MVGAICGQNLERNVQYLSNADGIVSIVDLRRRESKSIIFLKIVIVSNFDQISTCETKVNKPISTKTHAH